MRHCDGPGCHDEQDVRPGDTHPYEADQPWITAIWKSVVIDPLHFCSSRCANLYTAPPIMGVDYDIGGFTRVVSGDDPRDARRDVKNPAQKWDPRKDPPFQRPEEGVAA